MGRTAFAGFCMLALLVSCDALVDPQPCTLATCNSGLNININGAGWADGDYTLDLRLGTREHRCTFSPDAIAPAQLGAPPPEIECVPALSDTTVTARIGVYTNDRCPAGPDGTRPDGTGPDGGVPDAEAEPPSEPQHDCRHFIRVDSSEMPEQVAVRLALGDAVLIEETRSVEYAMFAPNGIECGPVCRVGSVELLTGE